MSEKTMKEEMLDDVKELRVQGRHLRDIGMPLLSHAAYRSARMRLRELQCRWDVAPCLCLQCRTRGDGACRPT
jgi:hypothetical protein